MAIVTTEVIALPNGRTKIPKDFLQSPNISFKAKGLFAYILSLPNGEFTVDDLVNAGSDGRTMISRCLKELIEHGYLVHRKIRDNGKISRGSYDVYPFGRGTQEDLDDTTLNVLQAS